jgi:hypothetical protein
MQIDYTIDKRYQRIILNRYMLNIPNIYSTYEKLSFFAFSCAN